jgi:hypothetical protein
LYPGEGDQLGTVISSHGSQWKRSLPGDDWVDGIPPLVLDGVQVRVTNPTVEHLNGYIVVSGVSAKLTERQQE